MSNNNWFSINVKKPKYDGFYLVECNDIVTSWVERCQYVNGCWLDVNGDEFAPTIEKWRCDYKNGDIVKYKSCFGDKNLIFIGHCEQLEYNNDAVVLYNGDCVPVSLSGLSLVKGDL